MKDRLSTLTQLLGIFALGVGCGIELAYGAECGFVLIAIGSIAFTVGEKLKRR